ncbi:MAG TPA: hypothetical protein VGK63_06395 [Candidatus Limnocylindrales bacterium]
MFPYKALVIARQLDELRAESTARRLAAARRDEPMEETRPRRPSVAEEPPVVVPRLIAYPYPAR